MGKNIVLYSLPCDQNHLNLTYNLTIQNLWDGPRQLWKSDLWKSIHMTLALAGRMKERKREREREGGRKGGRKKRKKEKL